MTLRPLTLEDMETIRHWRHGVMNTLRTPYMLTAEQQADYYRNVICDRRGTTRYWALWERMIQGVADGAGEIKWERMGPYQLIGYGGIENIEWENRRGELSILIGPEHRDKGYGVEGVALFLEQAFMYLNLENVHGECYGSGPWRFWEKVLAKYNAFTTWLPSTKYWEGRYVDSYYFNIKKEGYLHHTSQGGEQADTGEEHSGLPWQTSSSV